MSKRVSDGGYMGIYHLPSIYELRQSPVLYHKLIDVCVVVGIVRFLITYSEAQRLSRLLQTPNCLVYYHGVVVFD